MGKLFLVLTCPFQGETGTSPRKQSGLLSILPTCKAWGLGANCSLLSEIRGGVCPFLSFGPLFQSHLLREVFPAHPVLRNCPHSLALSLFSLSSEIFSHVIAHIDFCPYAFVNFLLPWQQRTHRSCSLLCSHPLAPSKIQQIFVEWINA